MRRDLLAAPTAQARTPPKARPAEKAAAPATATAAARRWQSAAAAVLSEASAPDGSLVFSADSLQVHVNPQDLLLAALERARARVQASEAAAAAEVPEALGVVC